mgnify:CR=1 FL=1
MNYYNIGGDDLNELVKSKSNKDSELTKSNKTELKTTIENSKMNIKISKGELLEFRIKRLLFSMGYFCKIGVIINADRSEFSDNITDLDVLGFSMHKDFTCKSIWADCKSGNAKPLERISWINGVKRFADIDDVVFVKKGVRVSTKQFARKSGIQIMDLEVLQKFENDYKIEDTSVEGSWDYNTQKECETILKNIRIYKSENIKKILKFIKVNYWSLDEYTQVKKCITALNQLGDFLKMPISDNEIKALKWAVYEVVSLFVLSTIKICRNTYYFNNRDRNQIITEGITSGETVNKERQKEIVEASYKIINSVIRTQVPGFTGNITVPNLDIKPPKYLEAYLDLIERMTSNPLEYYDILRFLDYILMEYDLKNKKVAIDETNKYFINSTVLERGSKTILHLICSVTNLPKDIFSIIR